MDVGEESPKVHLLPNQFEKPSLQEVYGGEGLIGKKIAILWDGDKVFYPANIIRYDPSTQAYTVCYHKDDSGSEYAENLKKTVWKVWRGSDEEFEAYFNQEVGENFILPTINRPIMVHNGLEVFLSQL